MGAACMACKSTFPKKTKLRNNPENIYISPFRLPSKDFSSSPRN